MKRAAVIPHDALAWCPAVSIDARLRCDHLVELLDQRAAFRVIHAFDRLGMIAEENSLAPSLRMRAHNWMRDRRHLGLLFRSQRVLAVATCARKVEIVNSAAAFDRSLHGGGKQVIGGINLGALCVLPSLRSYMR